jgi:hypothetical protein
MVILETELRICGGGASEATASMTYSAETSDELEQGCVMQP